MSNIKPILSLNKHPNNCENLSLVGANNVQLSNDFATFISEKSLVHGNFENRIIKKIQTDGNQSDVQHIKIVGWIPCNTEFILFVVNAVDLHYITENGINLNLIRYDEKLDEFTGKYSGLKYYDGTIIGTFTYNGRGQLVIAYGESDAKVDVPLKTIVLGTFEEMKNNSDNTDINLNDNKVSVCPEVRIPEVINIQSISGNVTKGYYDIFIRFKINKNDYTKWYYIHTQFIGSLNKTNIIKTYQITDNSFTKSSQGCVDHIDIKDSNSTNSIQFGLNNMNVISYDFFQLGYICQSNDSTVGFRTSDIKNINDNGIINNIIINNNLFNIQLITEDLIDFYNYYNVKNIINYQNRLYISNYKEKEDIDEDELNEILNNIEVQLDVTLNKRTDSKIVITSEDGKTQYEVNDINNTTGVEALGIPIGTYLKAEKKETTNKFDLYCSIISPNTVHIEEGVTYGSSVFNPWNYTSYANSQGIVDRNGTCKIIYNNETVYSGTANMHISFVMKSDDSGIDTTVQPTTSYLQCKFTLDDGSTGTLTANSIPGTSNLVSVPFAIVYNNISSEGNAEDFKFNISDNENLIVQYKDEEPINQPTLYLANGDIINTTDIVYKRNFYINTGESFQDRQIETTLIPGEIYNLFIHFVDKYGEYTKGYRLNNNTDFYDDIVNNKTNAFISIFDYTSNQIIGVSSVCNKIAICPIEQEIFDVNGDINFNNIYIADNDRLYDTNDITYIPINNSFASYAKASLTEKVKNLPKDTHITWGDIQDAYSDAFWYEIGQPPYSGSVSTSRMFTDDLEEAVKNIKYAIPYTNSEGNKLFRIPDIQPYNIIVNGNHEDIRFPFNGSFGKDYEHTVYDSVDKVINVFPIIKVKLNNVTVPDGYIGAFISYEKLEKRKIASGILSKNDCIIDNKEFAGNISHKNNDDNNYMQFFCSDYDILDSIDFDYSFACAKYIMFCGLPNGEDYYYNSELFSYCFNQPVIHWMSKSINFRISNPNIAAGGDITKNKLGIGSSLILNSFESLYPTNIDRIPFYMYYTDMYKINKQIYTNKNKTLIPLSSIYYINSNGKIEDGKLISSKENGRMSYDSIISYNGNSVILNTGNSNIIDYDMDKYKQTSGMTRYAGLFQFPLINDYPKEAKYINNRPQNTAFFVQSTEVENANMVNGFYVSPENSIDLFRNNYTNYSRIKTYIHYNKDSYYIYEYNNYVRRSNVIQDESLINSWRTFPIEGYKIISENKGKITNLVGIGTVLIVHCEHSLFMFDRDNTLQTMDKAVQLQMPDIFDVDYKEVITSDLGYAGLQDRKSAIVDQFGYIFYDTDKNRFYQYNNGKLDYIDNDIVNFLNNYKPTNIRFANDKLNNRLIISLIFNNNRYTLSYNYGVNKFISFHDYVFSDAFNTKNELYILYTDNFNVDEENTKILIFTKDEKYRTIEYSDGTIKNVKCHLNFIINDNYNIIKYFEYITYKLYEISNTDINYPLNTVGERVQPYSGETLRVYNDLIDTKELDIKVNSEDNKNIFENYKKPYWDLGNWNFSYLRDKKQTNVVLSRLYGNYFILNFIFGQDNQRKVEFEDINYMISKDK